MPVGIPTPFNQLHCAAGCPSFPLGQNGFANRPFTDNNKNSVSYRIVRSEEHTSELQSLMRISYAVLCLKKKKTTKHTRQAQRSLLSEPKQTKYINTNKQH